MDYRLVAKTIGILLALFSASMLVVVPVAVLHGEWTQLLQVVLASLAGLLASVLLWFPGRNAKGDLFRREAIAVVGVSWLAAAMLGALPFLATGDIPAPPDAFFESMSGLTTTGSSILSDIEALSKTGLFWRAFLHFLGGLGIIVLFVAVLPLLGGSGAGGRILFKRETAGPTPEGVTPRIKDTVVRILWIYLAFNAVQAVLLLVAGMEWFDAVCNAMSTNATGGFSPNNASIGGYGSKAIEWIMIVFMFMAATSFRLHMDGVRGKLRAYWRDTEFRVFLGLAVVPVALVAWTLWGFPFGPGEEAALTQASGPPVRDSLFATLSVHTGTGFATADFGLWPAGTHVLLILLMLIGGCAGSTAGGLKIIRVVILWKAMVHAVTRNVSPQRVRAIKIDGKPIDRELINEVQVFVLIWLAVMAAGTMAVAWLSPGQDLLTSFTAVVATLNNVGPGLAGVGPYSNFGDQGAAVKVLLSLFMLMGRLEIYPLLLLAAPRFWRGD